MEICSSGDPTGGGDDDSGGGGGVIHAHCANCVRLWKCTARPRGGNAVDCCEIVSCEAECGARYHACKGREHRLLCANEKVACINAVSGCPVWMFRRLLGRHLRTCPASVVHCTMEWNRWPVCSSERKLHIPFHQPNPNARAGQLDVALALRDQRMLNEWLSAPRRTRRALRNSLTRRFPAVPLQIRGNGGTALSSATILEAGGGCVGGGDSENSSLYPSRGMTDDEEDTPWEARKAPPGLQRSVCGELYRASKQTTDSLTAALNIITNHAAANVVTHRTPLVRDPQLQQQPTQRAQPVGNGWVRYYGLHDPDKENRFGRVTSTGWQDCDGRKRFFSTSPDDDDTAVDDAFVEYMDVERYPGYHAGGSSPPTGGLGHHASNGINGNGVETGMDLGLEVEVGRLPDAYDEAPGSYDILFVNHTVVSEISSASMTDHARKPPAVVTPVPASALASLVAAAAAASSAVPPPPPTSPPLFVNLGLDLTLESITRYQAKPKSMYTFLCAQEFRRDEYGWHYKNVHSDIHGGLNGWIEQRCPLAHYGCMHSVRRFFPTCCGSSIVHNDILESFGVRPTSSRLQPLLPSSSLQSPPALSPSSSTSAIQQQQQQHSGLLLRISPGSPLSPTRGNSAERRTPPRAVVTNDHGIKSNGAVISSCWPMEVIHENGVGGSGASRSHSPSSAVNGDEDDGKKVEDDSSESCFGGPLLLTQLPFEVLQHAARFLDGFSLCNLSMTTRLLREVCCSLLEERGIVVQQWERVQHRNKYRWRIAYKRWFFSTAFTPIRQWGFEEKENMANHLKKCLYNQRDYKTEPYFYPVGINQNPHILAKLKAGIEQMRQKDAASVGNDATTKL